MKKPIAALIAISALILSLTTSLANAQPSPPTGVFDLLPAGDPLPSPVPSNVKGFSVRENWADISSSCPTGPGSYNWGNMDTDIQQAADSGNSYEVLLSIGDSPNQAPSWVCNPSGTGGVQKNADGTYSCDGLAPACNTVNLYTNASITVPVFWDTQYLNAKHQLLEALVTHLTNKQDPNNNGKAEINEITAFRAQCAGIQSEDWNVPSGVKGQPGQMINNTQHWLNAGYTSNQLIQTCKDELDFMHNHFRNTSGVSIPVVWAISDDGNLDPTANGGGSNCPSSTDPCAHISATPGCNYNGGACNYNCVSLAFVNYAITNYSNTFIPETDDLIYDSSMMTIKHTPSWDGSGNIDGWETLGCVTPAGVGEQEAGGEASNSDFRCMADYGESYGPEFVEVYPNDFSYSAVGNLAACLANSNNCVCQARHTCSPSNC